MANAVRVWVEEVKRYYTTELQMQACICFWFWNAYPSERRMLHMNNNNSFNSIEGATKKAEGVVDGVSDLEFIDWGGKVWFIELKLPGGVQSKQQEDFQNKVESRGHSYTIFYSFVETKNFLTERICQALLTEMGT